MNLQRLGTDYGGWTIDLDSVPDDSVILDVGVRDDSSFLRALLDLKRVTALAIDPSPAALVHFKRLGVPPRTVFIPRALTADGGAVVMRRGDERSDSGCQGMPGMTDQPYRAQGVSLRELLDNNPVSLVKLDIEGMEFDLVEQAIGVPQVAVEFHVDHMPDRRDDMERIVAAFVAAGYAVVDRTERHEITFLRT